MYIKDMSGTSWHSNQTNQPVMAFTRMNPETNKTWTREELYAALLEEQAKNSTDGLISRQRYMQDISARWQIHLTESRAFAIDLLNAGRWTRTQFNRLLA